MAAGLLIVGLAISVGAQLGAQDTDGPDPVVQTVLRGLRHREEMATGYSGLLVTSWFTDRQFEATMRAGLRALGASKPEELSAETQGQAGPLVTVLASKFMFDKTNAYSDTVELHHGMNRIGCQDYEGIPESARACCLRQVRAETSEWVVEIDYSTQVCSLKARDPIGPRIEPVARVWRGAISTLETTRVPFLEDWATGPAEYRPRLAGKKTLEGVECLILDFPGKQADLRLLVAPDRDFCVMREETIDHEPEAPRHAIAYRFRKRSALTKIGGLWVPLQVEFQAYMRTSDPASPWKWVESSVMRLDELAPLANDWQAGGLSLSTLIPTGFGVYGQMKDVYAGIGQETKLRAAASPSMPPAELAPGARPEFEKASQALH